MPVSYDHIGRDIIIVAVMFLLVFAVLLLCWFLRFSWQSLTRRWLRRRRFETDVHNLPFPIQEQPQEAWMSNGKPRVQRLLGKDNLYHKPSDKIM